MRKPPGRAVKIFSVLLLPLLSAIPAFAYSPIAKCPGVLRHRLLEDRASVAGTVVDENGSPVSGAEVELVEIPDSPRTCWDEEASANYHATRTGLTGHFEVGGLPATLIDLRIDYPGFAPLIRKGIIVPDPVGAVNVGRLTLDAGRKVDGIVVDGKGRPLAGTAIWVRSMEPGPEGYPFLRRGPRQVTGSDGRFSIHVEPKGPFELYACRRDRSRLTETLDGPSRPLRIVMPASGRLPGRIVDSEGRPVPGALVAVARVAAEPPRDVIDPYAPCPQTYSSASATTDTEGRFVLEPIAQGVFGVRVSADDFVPYIQPEARLGGAGGPRSLDIVLRPGASLTGQVRSATGAPLPGANIRLSCPDGGSNALTGPDGRYRLSGLSPGGTCRLSASKYRFNEAQETVEIKAAVNHHLDLRLVPTQTVEIHGRVIGPAGEPVAGAKVESPGAFEGGENLTGLDGFFTVKAYAGSSDCALSAGKEGYAPYRSPSVPCGEAAAKEAVIRLERPLTLTVHLLNRDLDPEQLLNVHVYAENDLFSTPSSSVSPDGTYRIEDLGPGEWKVSASVGRRFVEDQVTLRPGQEGATLDLSFRSQFPVRGRVFGPEGEGIAGALLDFPGAGSFSNQVLTQADGSFEILLENGSYEVKARGPNTPAQDHWSIDLPPITVADAPLEGIDVHLKRGVALHGCIPGLLPDDQLGIFASRQGTTWVPWIEADGCYRFKNLEPGDWSITARLDTRCRNCRFMSGDGRDRKIESHVAVAAGDSETALDLDFALGDRTLTVRPAGADKSGELCLRLFFDGGTLIEPACQERDGAFRVPRLRAGDYLIQILDRKDQILLQRSVELTSDQEILVEVP